MALSLANPHNTSPPRRGYWIIEGRLLAGAYPGSANPAKHRAKIQGLLEPGIRAFVNLMEPDETDHNGGSFVSYEPLVGELCPAAQCRRFPVRDLSVPSRQTMQQILDAVDGFLAERRPVYIRCWGGVGRTGTVIACWLLRHRMATVDNVYSVLGHLRKQDTEHGHRPWPESSSQRDFVAAWID